MSECIRPDFREIDIELLRTGNLADGTVKCNGRTWKVHRLLLASRLKFFKAAFFGSFKALSPKSMTRFSEMMTLTLLDRRQRPERSNSPRLTPMQSTSCCGISTAKVQWRH